MSKKETLSNLLVAESCKAMALRDMNWCIENEYYESAMGWQLEYLYWHDEVNRLSDKFGRERFKLALIFNGV